MKERKGRGIYTAGIYLLMFMASFCTTTQGVMLTHYIEYYQLESFEQGLMSAFQSGGNLAALFLLGVLVGRLKKRNILMITAVLIPCVFLMFGLRPALYIFLAGYFVYGVVFGFLDSLASSMMVDLYPENSSFYMNLLHGIYGLGGLIGPVILSWFDSAGIVWNRILFLTGILAMAASAVYILASFYTRNMELSSMKEEKITRKHVIDFLKGRKERVLFFCAFFYGAHQIGITVWMTRYISDYLNERKLGALALSVFWVCVAVSRLVFPRFGWGGWKAVRNGHLVSGLAVLAGVLSGNGAVMFLCTGISGLAEGMILPLTLDIGCHWNPGRTSLGSSMVLLAHYIGFIIMPMVMGGVISAFNISAGMMFPALLSFAAAILIYISDGMQGEHLEN